MRAHRGANAQRPARLRYALSFAALIGSLRTRWPEAA
jgi:hypothetical protein